MISAGELAQRVTFQRRVATVDSLGQESKGWQDYATVWARVLTTGGREQMQAGAVRSEATIEVRVRYRADLLMDSITQRIMWQGVAYDVVRPPQDVKGARVAIDVFASTGARDGER
jgi:SPP1 family predicted phage head-tail adaptor